MLDVLIVGAGPAGLYAADRISAEGFSVRVVERMPSPARKFLMAGRGGLNLTHSENLNDFKHSYREAEDFLAPMLDAFSPDDLRRLCHELGEDTFVGSSGRVFPKKMKASPLLRALLKRLERNRATLQTRWTWTGIAKDGTSQFISETGAVHEIRARATLLALGGASWPRLGSNAAWVPALETHGIEIHPFRPANCGFRVAWSPHLTDRFAGTPLKRIRLSLGDRTVLGEALLSEQGIEGGAVYALSAEIRGALETSGKAALVADLKPQMSLDKLVLRLSAGRGKQSLSNFLRKAAGLSAAEIALIREAGRMPDTPEDLARLIKSVPIPVNAPYDIDRAISSAGGIALEEVDANLMLKKLPGVFAAGEMLDWEAPTGGYLLQACFSMSDRAARGILELLKTAREATTA
ncbi:NAD(P)/FAD-dependent oxidoreductase [Roseibium aggregatum]|uniref:TIGR03862 family flavoprotein n=1 Tax=Roseibium aggregatum TaxID=187304 RepID=A0A926NXM5_9HYPH|nr:TIGR03862 family flavoprotein [Roseibium aggregatum]MBD1546211.1 TIGR03862 family flavoprotein [Roseibium aggregatum]